MFEQRVYLLKQHIDELLDLVEKEKISPDRFRKLALQAELKFIKNNSKNKRLYWIFFLSLIVLLLSFIYIYEPVNHHLLALFRISMIQILPFWDWTIYFETGCLIANPYFEEKDYELNAESCNLCSNLSSIQKYKNVTVKVVESLLEEKIPFIVTKVSNSWPANNLFSLKFLFDLFNQNKEFNNEVPCSLVSSIPNDHSSFKDVLHHFTQLNDGEQWFVQWENCAKKMIRYFRRFFQRPPYLPVVVERGDTNWILLSKNYTSFIQIDVGTSLTWMAQIEGDYKIRLTPREPCNASCSNLYSTLHKGDIITWSEQLWYLDYMSHQHTSYKHQIAVLFGAHFEK